MYPNACSFFDEILANGFDGDHFIIGLASHFRNLLVGKDKSTLKLMEVSEGILKKYLQQSQETSISFLLSALSIANQCDINYRNSKNQRLHVEMALIRMCHIASALNLSEGTAIENSPSAQAEKEIKKKTEVNTSVSVTITNAPIVKGSAAAPDMPPVETPAPVIDETPTGLPDVKPAEEPPIEYASPPAPKVSVPKGSLVAASSIIPNLNELKEPSKAEEEKPDYITGESRNKFTKEIMLKLWNDYANLAKTSGKINLFTIMTANTPDLLEDFNIELSVENKMQENLLVAEKIDLLNFLRTKLENFGIGIITKLAEQTTKKRLYTSTDKYQHMAEKNPKLEDFRKMFNLDIEY